MQRCAGRLAGSANTESSPVSGRDAREYAANFLRHTSVHGTLPDLIDDTQTRFVGMGNPMLSPASIGERRPAVVNADGSGQLTPGQIVPRRLITANIWPLNSRSSAR